jgi:hypothetical protein
MNARFHRSDHDEQGNIALRQLLLKIDDGFQRVGLRGDGARVAGALARLQLPRFEESPARLSNRHRDDTSASCRARGKLVRCRSQTSQCRLRARQNPLIHNGVFFESVFILVDFRRSWQHLFYVAHLRAEDSFSREGSSAKTS